MTINPSRVPYRGIAAIACVVCGITPLAASNGLNVIGYSGESEMMGGADVAVARDVTALATNPAGLTQIGNAQLNVFASPYYSVDIRHEDSVGNDKESKPPYGILGGGGYVHRLNPDVVVGAGLFVQGGSGFAYEDLDSGFGAQGELSALFSIFKFVPGVAWKLNDQLSLGGAVNLIYANARQKTFADSSIQNVEVPAASFYGSRLDGLTAFAAGVKLGLQYRPDPAWTIGLSFGSKAPLDLKGGEMKVNYEALGLGRVTYQDAKIDGLAIAQDVSLGVAHRPNERWLLSAELSWLDWSSAIKTIRTTARNPAGNPDPDLVPATQFLETPLDYRDQYVVALGASYDWDDKTRLRGGLNYARHPTPDRNLNPLFAVIGQHHVSFGFARDLSEKWEVSAGIQVQGPYSEKYRNPSTPFTADAKETNFAVWLSTSVIRRW